MSFEEFERVPPAAEVRRRGERGPAVGPVISFKDLSQCGFEFALFELIFR